MGPIYDELGLEQGGPSSSEFYQIYKNEQLSSSQRSGLGTGIAGITGASVGLADDTALRPMAFISCKWKNQPMSRIQS